MLDKLINTGFVQDTQQKANEIDVTLEALFWIIIPVSLILCLAVISYGPKKVSDYARERLGLIIACSIAISLVGQFVLFVRGI